MEFLWASKDLKVFKKGQTFLRTYEAKLQVAKGRVIKAIPI